MFTVGPETKEFSKMLVKTINKISMLAWDNIEDMEREKFQLPSNTQWDTDNF